MSKAMEEAVVKAAVPTTHMRRLWYKFYGLQPSRSITLGKRNRGALRAVGLRNRASPTATLETSAVTLNAANVTESSSEESVVLEEDIRGGSGLGALQIDTPVKQHAGVAPNERARVAIQQSDSLFDAVVVTTLPCYPFRRHEDLIKMSRIELVATANLLNAHLPRAMQIEVSAAVSDARIRRVIERLVGIVPTTPGAPKATGKTWASNNRSNKTKNLSPPPSPLAMRVSRRRGAAKTAGSSMVPLETLDEVDESDFLANQRPLKRRKVSDILATPTFFERQAVMADTWPSDL